MDERRSVSAPIRRWRSPHRRLRRTDRGLSTGALPLRRPSAPGAVERGGRSGRDARGGVDAVQAGQAHLTRVTVRDARQQDRRPLPARCPGQEGLRRCAGCSTRGTCRARPPSVPRHKSGRGRPDRAGKALHSPDVLGRLRRVRGCADPRPHRVDRLGNSHSGAPKTTGPAWERVVNCGDHRCLGEARHGEARSTQPGEAPPRGVHRTGRPSTPWSSCAYRRGGHAGTPACAGAGAHQRVPNSSIDGRGSLDATAGEDVAKRCKTSLGSRGIVRRDDEDFRRRRVRLRRSSAANRDRAARYRRFTRHFARFRRRPPFDH